jgi:hypothetical protein
VQQFTVRCHQWLAESLAARVDAEKELEELWRDAQRAMIPEFATPAEETALHEAIQAEFDELRKADQMLSTRSALIIPALKAELEERGWMRRRWKPVPAGVRSRRGRRVGTPDQRFTHRFVVQLPDNLGTRLVRACYNSSKKSVEGLQEWRLTFGDGPRGSLHKGEFWTGAGPSRTDMRRKEKFLSGITYPPDVLRAAAQRVVASPEPGSVTSAADEPA